MNVVFKESIQDRIKNIKNDAALTGREIEKIQITVKEARQLLRELDSESGSRYLRLSYLVNFEQWLNDFDVWYPAHAPYVPVVRAQPVLWVLGVNLQVVA